MKGLIFLLSLFMLSACGTGSTQQPAIKPAQITVDLNSREGFYLRWDDSDNATHYQLLQRKAGETSFSQIGDDLPAGRHSDGNNYSFLAEENSFFQLNSCNADTCKASAMISIRAPSTMTMNLEDNDRVRFGWSDVSYASYYQVWKRGNDETEFTQVSDNIAAGQQEFLTTASLEMLQDMEFELRACNASGCTVGKPVKEMHTSLKVHFKKLMVDDEFFLRWEDAYYVTYYNLYKKISSEKDFTLIEKKLIRGKTHQNLYDFSDEKDTFFKLESCNVSSCMSSILRIETAAPSLVTTTDKAFQFVWQDVSYASHYQLWQDITGAGSFEKVADNIPAGTEQYQYDITKLADYAASEYRLKSCNTTGCSLSESINIQPAQIKSLFSKKDYLKFTWPDVGFANYYQLLEDPDGASGFKQIGINIVPGTESVDHAVTLADRKTAKYQLNSCNAVGCLPSAPITVNFKAASPSIKFSNNGYMIRWIDVANATHYQVEENSDGVSNFISVSNNIDPAEQQYDHRVADYANRMKAQYRLQTCYVVGCLESPPLAVSGFVPAELSLSFAPDKTFSFTWLDTNNASYFQLWENPDGASGYRQLSGDISVGEQRFDHAVPLYARTNAQYLLYSCNDQMGCLSSPVVSVAGTMVNSISYFKASNSDAHDEFGNSVALSHDGRTLAIGSPNESSELDVSTYNSANNDASNSGAVYVFILTNMGWVEQALIKATDGEINDSFGKSVSLSADGHTLAVGATGEDSDAQGINGDRMNNDASVSGAAYVYTRNMNSWSEQAYIKASNSGASDVFGHSISLSDDGHTLAVSAMREKSAAKGINGDSSDNTMRESGAVYVFDRTGDSWSEQAYIKASNTGLTHRFGNGIEISGSGQFLVVGAYYERGGGSTVNSDGNADNKRWSGAAYIFSRTSGQWLEQAYLKASNSEERIFFGWSVAINKAGNVVAIGAKDESRAGQGVNDNQVLGVSSSAGAVYLFRRSETQWQQTDYIKASNTGEGDNFGTSVSLSDSGDWLAISSSLEKSSATGINGDQLSDTADNSGAVYVFSYNGIAWQQQAYVKASNTGASDLFGYTVALSGDGESMAVNGRWEDSAAKSVNGDQTDNSAENSGAVYVY